MLDFGARLMLTIKLHLDEDCGIDEIDVLGDLIISDNHSTIAVNTTYLDSWLAELIDAADRLPKEGHVDVAAPEEPVPIRLEMGSDNRVRLSYKEQLVVADSMNDFRTALKAAAKSLLDSVDNLPRSRENKILDPIRRYYQRDL
jgi:hypothetical protein